MILRETGEGILPASGVQKKNMILAATHPWFLGSGQSGRLVSFRHSDKEPAHGLIRRTPFLRHSTTSCCVVDRHGWSGRLSAFYKRRLALGFGFRGGISFERIGSTSYAGRFSKNLNRTSFAEISIPDENPLARRRARARPASLEHPLA